MTERGNPLANHPARVSFTVRRPSPLSSRQSSVGPESDSTTSGFKVPHLTSSNSVNSPLRSGVQRRAPPPKSVHSGNGAGRHSDSSDEEDGSGAEELVSGFDAMGVQRVKPAAKQTGPLVIPLVANRDWRAMARARQAARGFVPDGAKAAAVVGVDGSQGGLGTKDSINSGPQLAGLVMTTIKKEEELDGGLVVSTGSKEASGVAKVEPEDVEMSQAVEPMDEDERALQAILRGSIGSSDQPEMELAAIPALDEAAAFERDMNDLPEQATLDDYARVPVEQFGAAMLRGMGWKPPLKGEDELWLPSKRPSLLGIGAKLKAVSESSGTGKAGGSKPGWMKRAEEKRYVPLIKKERETGRSHSDVERSETGRVSRRTSRSRSPPGGEGSSRRRSPGSNGTVSSSSRGDRDMDGRRDRDRAGERDRDRDRDSGRDSYKDRDAGRDKDRDRRRDDDRRRDRRDNGYSNRGGKEGDRESGRGSRRDIGR